MITLNVFDPTTPSEELPVSTTKKPAPVHTPAPRPSDRLALVVEVVGLLDRLEALERSLGAGGRFAGALADPEADALTRAADQAWHALTNARPKLA